MKVWEAERDRVTFTGVQGGHIHEDEDHGYTPADRNRLLSAIRRDQQTARLANDLIARVGGAES